MLQAWMILPALGIGYLLAAPGGLGRRTWQLGVAGLVMLVVSLTRRERCGGAGRQLGGILLRHGPRPGLRSHVRRNWLGNAVRMRRGPQLVRAASLRHELDDGTRFKAVA